MKSIFEGKDFIAVVDDQTGNEIMADIIGRKKPHIEIDGELYRASFLKIKNGDFSPSLSRSDKKQKYDLHHICTVMFVALCV